MHGENMLLPVQELPKNAEKIKTGKSFIFAHSETGHNHVIEAEKASDLAVYEFNGQVYIKVNNESKITHKKSFDIHQPIEIMPGIYKVNKKTEYDPFQGIVREVYD